MGCHFLLQGYNIANRVNNTVLYSLKYVRGIDCIHTTQKNTRTFLEMIGMFLWASKVAQWLKNPPANAGDSGSIPGLGRSPWE